MTGQTPTSRNDLVRQPLSFFLWWGLPLGIGVIGALLHLSLRVGAGMCVLLFVWMATGCLLNARRCHRLHCYISGPIFLLAATFAALVALGVVGVSAHAFDDVVGATLILALLSFVPEMVWKRYV